jgi:hypothetical protein
MTHVDADRQARRRERKGANLLASQVLDRRSSTEFGDQVAPGVMKRAQWRGRLAPVQKR